MIKFIKDRIAVILKIIMWIITGGIALFGLLLSIFFAGGIWSSTGDIGLAIIVGLGIMIGAGIAAFTFFSIGIVIYNTVLYEVMARESAEKFRKNKFDIDS